MKRVVKSMLPKILINKSVCIDCYKCNLFLVLTLLCLGACSPKHSSYSEFKEIPEIGWVKTDPCVYIPQFGDTAAIYDVKIAMCYEYSYQYRNISVVADFVKNDSVVLRKIADCTFADADGNKTSCGFGVAYQHEDKVLDNVQAGLFDKIILWQGMEEDTLKSVCRVGVTITPVNE